MRPNDTGRKRKKGKRRKEKEEKKKREEEKEGEEKGGVEGRVYHSEAKSSGLLLLSLDK